MAHVWPIFDRDVDADGIMIRAAAAIGRNDAERGYPYNPHYNTPKREKAYRDAYWQAKRGA